MLSTVNKTQLAAPARRTGWLWKLASPRWTVAFFLLAAMAALAVAGQQGSATAWMALPFALLSINLLASIAVHPRFRTDLPLLLFHLVLVMLVILFAVARLTYLEGKATLTEGATFMGQLEGEMRGPLHPNSLPKLRFSNEGFTENFPANGHSRATYNQVHWQDNTGALHMAEIGDDTPLILDGYRIYTSGNRGFSPSFVWQPLKGMEESGTVQLRAGEFDMANTWQLPGGPEIWAKLDLALPARVQRGERRENLGAHQLPHALVIRAEGRREVLQPGQSMSLSQGRLTYVRLESWMGYHIVYDPTQPWLVATLLVGIGSLLWFYVRRLWGPSSLDDES